MVVRTGPQCHPAPQPPGSCLDRAGGDSMLVSAEGCWIDLSPCHLRSGLFWELGTGPDLVVGDHIPSAVGRGGAAWTHIVRDYRTETSCCVTSLSLHGLFFPSCSVCPPEQRVSLLWVSALNIFPPSCALPNFRNRVRHLSSVFP